LREHADGATLGVLMLRFDRLREYAHLFGFEARDRVLGSAREMVANAVRPSDEVVPFDDDSFVVLLPNLMSANHALLGTSKILRALREPLPGGGPVRRLPMTASIGVAVSPVHGTQAEALCRRADAACLAASRKDERFAMYESSGLHDDVSYDELRAALAASELDLHLQPIVDLRDGRTIGAEALTRWEHPRLGPINPASFVAVAEQTGLIVELTRWSINTALRHAATALDRGRSLRFSINLSPAMLHDTGFVDEVASLLRFWELPPATLAFELTENAIMEDLATSSVILERLGASGVAISIDDFGTGLSSFSYLKRFRASELKIDQTFVQDLVSDDRARQLVVAMVELAHRLDMRAVAEGVEHADTHDALAAIGCDLAQGYRYGRPRPADQFIAEHAPID
jgi:diguanylate cyclase (GGDEF)-like protein